MNEYLREHNMLNWNQQLWYVDEAEDTHKKVNRFFHQYILTLKIFKEPLKYSRMTSKGKY